MRHGEGDELLPVLWTGKPPRSFQPFVERRGRKGGEQTENGQPRRPGTDGLQGTIRDAGGVVVHPEDKRGEVINTPLREPVEHNRVLARFVEAFVDARKVGR